MSDSKMFRQKALDAYNTREEFQRAIRIISPKSWIYLIIIFLLFIAGLIWLIFGSVTTLVQAQGIMLTKNNDLEVVAFFNIDVGKKITLGMPATVYPTHINSLEFGGIEAKVNYVSEFPISPQDLRGLLNNQKLVDEFMKNGPVFAVRLELIKSAETQTGYRWTTSSGPGGSITAGSIANVAIATSKERPIKLIIHVARSTADGQ